MDHMGLSENSVPNDPMVNDHYPYYFIGGIPHFQTYPHRSSGSEAASGAGGGPQRVARRGGGLPPRRLRRQRPLRHRDEFEAALGASEGTSQQVV